MVALVGRTNVGKSTLFNALSVNVKSLTFDEAGITRDCVVDTIEWCGKHFTLVDTGGIVRRASSRSSIDVAIQQRALQMIEQAAVVVFVGDGAVGVLEEDKEIARLLHSYNKKVVVVMNKEDQGEIEYRLYEFRSLGFSDIIAISAQHKRGLDFLLEYIVSALPITAFQENKKEYRIVLLGKPNVGKSSLLNALAQEERAIVSDIPGTTREAISYSFTFYKELIDIIDTPGIRKKHAVQESVEKLMVGSSFRAVEKAHIVLLVIDASAGVLSDQEIKLAFYALEQHKALIFVCNKVDLLDAEKREQFEASLKEYGFLTEKVRIIFVSCKTDKNVGKVLLLVQKVWELYAQRFSDEELTMICKEALDKKPLYRNQQRLILHKVKQVATAPITLVFHVNQPLWFGDSQRAFFERILRKAFSLQGTSLRFVFHKKK